MAQNKRVRSPRAKEVRIGVIGVGVMGSSHARKLLAGEIPRARLTAVCDVNPAQTRPFADSVRTYPSSRALIRSGDVDAVLVATPHYDHTTIGIEALQAGLHLLVEKPISVHKADAERLIAAHKGRKQVFAAMFNQRTLAHYRKVKELLDRKELGRIVRIQWTVTSWFRTEYYYRTGDWRATWAGEGGGVLLNQCPHQLDMMQWFFGMPKRVWSVCAIGKYHNIEVEDEVAAHLEYPNGATGVFITSTGEAPGTNRLEIAGDQGKLVVENNALQFTRNEIPTSKFSRTAKSSFGRPPVWNIDIPVKSGGGQHAAVMSNFVDAILDGAPLLADAREGLHSVELGNAMLYSSFLGKPVELPMDGKAYERLLKKKTRESKFVKKTVRSVGKQDLNASF